jgi:hypothetical protein
MGSPVALAVLACDGLPCFRSSGETTSEVGRSRQRRGLENGTGSEALTGEGCRGGQSRGEVAAPSSFGAPAQGRRVRVVGGAASAVNRGEKQRMEELTGVVRSAEVKQGQQNRAVRATFYGGGRRLTAQEDGRDTGGRWGNNDGSRRWPAGRLGGGRRWQGMLRRQRNQGGAMT